MTGTRRTQLALYTGGSAIAAWGAYGLITAVHSDPLAWARFAITVLIANDGVLAPLVIAAGVIVVRLIPAPARAYVQAGLLISGAVTVAALPVLLGYGRDPANPSILPLDYHRGLAIVLLLVWLAVGATAAVRWRAGRTRRPQG